MRLRLNLLDAAPVTLNPSDVTGEYLGCGRRANVAAPVGLDASSSSAAKVSLPGEPFEWNSEHKLVSRSHFQLRFVGGPHARWQARPGFRGHLAYGRFSGGKNNIQIALPRQRA